MLRNTTALPRGTVSSGTQEVDKRGVGREGGRRGGGGARRGGISGRVLSSNQPSRKPPGFFPSISDGEYSIPLALLPS